MTDMAGAVGELIMLCGGSIVGKTRLQKTAYFLESRGIGFGFTYRYHYYGPYSEALALAAEDAAALKIISAEPRPSTGGVSYYVYKSDQLAPLAVSSESDLTSRRRLLSVLQSFDTVTLELAATADFLSKHGFGDDPWKETIRRKSEKASPGRIEGAKRLLSSIDEFVQVSSK